MPVSPFCAAMVGIATPPTPEGLYSSDISTVSVTPCLLISVLLITITTNVMMYCTVDNKKKTIMKLTITIDLVMGKSLNLF